MDKLKIIFSFGASLWGAYGASNITSCLHNDVVVAAFYEEIIMNEII